MGKVKVTILDAVGNMRQTASVPDNAPIGRIVEKFVLLMNMPTRDVAGDFISYKVQHKNSGKQFYEMDTLLQHNVMNGDVLRLLPELKAGSL